MATHAQRHHAREVMDFMHRHAGQLLYPPGDQRTSRDGLSWHMSEQTLEHVLKGGGKWQGDCSEFGSYVLKLAGMWHWSEPGWTGSHLKLLPGHYTNGKQAGTAALIVMGLDRSANGLHEAIVHTPDPTHGDPLVASHGRPGFDLVRVSQLAVGELAGHVYLNVSHL